MCERVNDLKRVSYCVSYAHFVSNTCQLYNKLSSSSFSLAVDESILLEKRRFTARICNVHKEVKGLRRKIIFNIWNAKIYFRNMKTNFQRQFCAENHHYLDWSETLPYSCMTLITKNLVKDFINQKTLSMLLITLRAFLWIIDNFIISAKDF